MIQHNEAVASLCEQVGSAHIADTAIGGYNNYYYYYLHITHTIIMKSCAGVSNRLVLLMALQLLAFAMVLIHDMDIAAKCSASACFVEGV